MKYAFIRQHRQHYPLTRLCEMLEVSSSGYHDWRDRPESHRSQENKRLTAKIVHCHQQSRQIYGSPKIHQDLAEAGESCSVNRVARLMKVANIQSKVARKFVITTNSKNTMQPAPDRLQRQFTVKKSNQAWVSDTTFIGTRQGWLYLAVILDLFSRQVIGWAMGNHNNTELVQNALTMALFRRKQVNNIIVHSDQGSTYASSAYQQQLCDNQLQCSMSRKGNCHDNAVAESFFANLKNELIYHQDFTTRQEARSAIFDYIELFYNRKRLHQTLNYTSPEAYERMQAVA